MEYYQVGGSIPVELRPTLVLSAEEDLGITAGLQDRVIQVGACLLPPASARWGPAYYHIQLRACHPPP
jgi:hypothetical protein